jgi:uncharacterized phage protein (TIGR01671 family)
MREFKFRVWDKLAKRMIYHHNDNQQHFIIDLNGRFHNLQNGSGGDDYVIQQYTGLNDSNDVPIYEGDILKNHYDVGNNIIGQVLYEADHGGYIFQWKRKGRGHALGHGQDYKNLNCDVAFESVIVGNIFEHSELLN